MVIAGMPALEARDWMRRLTSNNHVDLVSSADLGPEAQVAFDSLVAAGYLQAYEKQPGIFSVTISGAALAMASANLPVKRSTAKRALAGVRVRAVEINDDPDLLLWVDKLAVFGSYLDPTAERLGDVDVAAWFSRRESDGQKYVAASLARARASGRNLRYIEQLMYGEREVRSRLKGRSPVVSLHNAEVDAIFNHIAVETVYERNKTAR